MFRPTLSERQCIMKKLFPYIERCFQLRKGLLLGAVFLSLLLPSEHVHAKELEAKTSKSGSEITVTAVDGSSIEAVYIKWNKAVQPYTLRTDSETLSCGENGFLHEFISLEEPTGTLTFSLPAENPMGIYAIRIFSDHDVPDDVQIWQPPCERADILLISAHSDDEILFMGGIAPTYVPEGARVQVAYMTEFWTTTPVREHEKLDGLWADGIRFYPVCGNFKDQYADNLAAAEKVYDAEAVTSCIAEMIDRFEPQVLVTHDFQGEYGHGFHQLTAKAAENALSLSKWQVPKVYFHLYPENKIHMDLNIPIASMGGKTALEIAKEAYLQHVSQQWCWFYVSDTYKYSCADFGLYRTSVGPDSENNMLEHIVLYAEQERIEQERRLEQERLEAEQKKAAELENIDRQLAAFQKEAQEKADAAKAELAALEQELEKARRRTTLVFLGGGLFLLLCISILILLMVRHPKRH